jgi:hypothetical protein
MRERLEQLHDALSKKSFTLLGQVSAEADLVDRTACWLDEFPVESRLPSRLAWASSAPTGSPAGSTGGLPRCCCRGDIGQRQWRRQVGRVSGRRDLPRYLVGPLYGREQFAARRRNVAPRNALDQVLLTCLVHRCERPLLAA